MKPAAATAIFVNARHVCEEAARTHNWCLHSTNMSLKMFITTSFKMGGMHMYLWLTCNNQLDGQYPWLTCINRLLQFYCYMYYGTSCNYCIGSSCTLKCTDCLDLRASTTAESGHCTCFWRNTLGFKTQAWFSNTLKETFKSCKPCD